MFDRLEIFRQAYGLARHAVERQSVIARNIANADTPGYRARDIPDFSTTLKRADEPGLRLSRPGHMRATGNEATYPPHPTDDPPSPNGNSVSLETEMVRAAETRREHEMALAIYSASLNILRTSLGRK